MGDYGSAAPWSDESVRGCRRFLERVAGLVDIATAEKEDSALESKVHKTIKKVSEDIENMKFNTAIAALMTLINDFYKAGSITKEDLKVFVKLLSPFAPHLTEEIWETIGENPDGNNLLTLSAWPDYDEAKTIDETVEIAVQINGKVRTTISIRRDAPKEEVLPMAKEAVASKLTGNIVKEIYVPGKIVNIVVKG